MPKIWPRGPAGPLALVMMELALVMMELMDWLIGQGYPSTTQRNHVRAAARLGSWMVSEGLTFDDLDADRVAGMIGEDNDRHPSHHAANESVSAVVRFLGETGSLGPAPVPKAEVGPALAFLVGWLRFLEVEQGQGASSIHKARRLGRLFLGLMEDQSGNLCWERVDVVRDGLVGHRQMSNRLPQCRSPHA